MDRATGSVQSVRISRDGQRVAFLEDPSGVGSGGRIRVLGKDGTELLKTRDWERARGLAWSPRGDEVWFTAAEGRANRTLRAVDMKGAVRVILTSPGSLTLWDAAPDGRALISRDDERMSVMGMGPGAAHERDLSVFDNAGLAAVSADGKRLLFGDRYGVYLRATDGGPPLKLGVKDVYPDDLSPDGTLVLATSASTDHLLVFPTGPGEAVTLPPHFIRSYVGARWFPDGNRILFNTWDRPASADAAPASPRSYVTDRSGAPPQPLTPPGVYSLAISPDGLQMAVRGAGPAISVWPVAGGQGTPVAGSQPGDRPVAWSEDGRSIWVFQRGHVPAEVARLDLASGKRVPWKTLVPPDPAGVYSINDVRITPRGDAYFYSYRRVLSELYLASAVE